MPIHENSRVAGEVTGLDTDTPARGEVRPALQLKASGAPSVETAPLGATQLAFPTAISVADPATGGALTVTYTEVSGGTTVDIAWFDADGDFVDIAEDAASTYAITGLTDDVEYTVYLRSVASDGRYGPWSAGYAETPTTT